MTHVSASAFCVWSVMSSALGAFLLGHIWRFDRFRCLRWTNAPYSGAFKRVMTYTYLLSIPLIIIYAFGFTYIKYAEGFLSIEGEVFVKPYNYWEEKHRRLIFPLMTVFSFAWSFEMITHLEELCFWLFLISAGPKQPDWFKSPFFRIWAIGSVIAFIYMPAVTIGYHKNPLTCEARTFFAGSLGDLVLTFAFVPILWKFPAFLQRVKAEGIEASVIIRLNKFYELNVVRVMFRLLFSIPLFILGTDGLAPHHHVNESMFWTDMLSIVSALGCVFSSVCTLLIFFPRSYEAEYQVKLASAERSGYSPSMKQGREAGPAIQPLNNPALEDLDEDDKPLSYEESQNAESFSSRKRLMSARSNQLARFPGAFKRTAEPISSGSPFAITPLPYSSGQPQEYNETHSNAQTQREDVGMRKGVPALTRKGTYLLTDSPVLRAKRIPAEDAGGVVIDARSVSYPPEPPYSAGIMAGGQDIFVNASIREKGPDQDDEDLVLGDRRLSRSPIVLSPNRREDFIQDLQPSASVRTTPSLKSGSRMLPFPPSPQNVPAPAYYPPDGVPDDSPLSDVKVASPEGILSPVYGSGSAFTPTLSHPLSNVVARPPPGAAALRPPYVREATDMFVADNTHDNDQGSTSATVGAKRRSKRLGTEGDERREASSKEPLTSANITRHNDVARVSQLNPLVRTFNSPIDFMDKVHVSGSRYHPSGPAV